MKKRLTEAAIFFVQMLGVALVLAGVYMIYPPAAVILAGAALFVCGAALFCQSREAPEEPSRNKEDGKT